MTNSIDPFIFWLSLIMITVGSFFLMLWYLTDNEEYDIYNRNQNNKNITHRAFVRLHISIPILSVGYFLLLFWSIRRYTVKKEIN